MLDVQDFVSGCILDLVQLLAQSIFYVILMVKFHLNPVLYVHVVPTWDAHCQGEQPCLFGTICGLENWHRSGPSHRAGKGEEQTKT